MIKNIIPWTIRRKPKLPKTTAEEKIELVTNMLFPPLEINSEVDKSGAPIKFHVDHSLDSNLDVVLMDLIDDKNDATVHQTLESVIRQLHDIRRMLGAYAMLDKTAEYIVVDNPKTESIDEIR